MKLHKKKKLALIDFPLVKKLDAHFTFRTSKILGLFEVKRKVDLKIRDVEVYGEVGENLMRYGLPQYKVPKLHFSIGKTKISTSNKLAQYFGNEMLHILNSIASKVTEWFGEATTKIYVERFMDHITNYYEYPFKWWHQGRPSEFELDLRQTFPPLWGSDFINFYFLGDLNYRY